MRRSKQYLGSRWVSTSSVVNVELCLHEQEWRQIIVFVIARKGQQAECRSAPSIRVTFDLSRVYKEYSSTILSSHHCHPVSQSCPDLEAECTTKHRSRCVLYAASRVGPEVATVTIVLNLPPSTHAINLQPCHYVNPSCFRSGRPALRPFSIHSASLQCWERELTMFLHCESQYVCCWSVHGQLSPSDGCEGPHYFS